MSDSDSSERAENRFLQAIGITEDMETGREAIDKERVFRYEVFVVGKKRDWTDLAGTGLDEVVTN